MARAGVLLALAIVACAFVEGAGAGRADGGGAAVPAAAAAAARSTTAKTPHLQLIGRFHPGRTSGLTLPQASPSCLLNILPCSSNAV